MSDRAAFFRAVLLSDFVSFVEMCFATLEPGAEYHDNWHIHAIAHELMAVWSGQSQRLIVNQPPRSMKSITVTIAFTAWVLGHDPRKRIMVISYSNEIVINMQRLHQDDLVGDVLDKEPWAVLSIPAIATEDSTYRTGPDPEDNYERRAGEALHPTREPLERLEAARRNLGTLNFAAQYQQNPMPAEGNVIKRDWIRYYDRTTDEFELKIVSWDTASTLSETSDWSVGTVWGAIGQEYYLLDVVRGRWESTELRRRMLARLLTSPVDRETAGGGDVVDLDVIALLTELQVLDPCGAVHPLRALSDQEAEVAARRRVEACGELLREFGVGERILVVAAVDQVGADRSPDQIVSTAPMDNVGIGASVQFVRLREVADVVVRREDRAEARRLNVVTSEVLSSFAENARAHVNGWKRPESVVPHGPKDVATSREQLAPTVDTAAGAQSCLTGVHEREQVIRPIALVEDMLAIEAGVTEQHEERSTGPR